MGYFLADKTSTYHYDQVGSTAALTAQDGSTVTDRFQYSPYGVLTYREGTTDTAFQYNGKYGVMTDSNGLLYMRARYYHPVLRRFINADPIGFAGGLNWYAYAEGNPILYVDPNGLDAYIDIGFTQARGHGLYGQYHTYTMITDTETGEQFVTRAGPSVDGISGSSSNAASSTAGGSLPGSQGNGRSGGVGLGYLRADGDVYQDHPFDNPLNTVYLQPVGRILDDFQDVVDAAQNFQSVTNDNRITYSPAGQGAIGYNSNSYTGTFIESLGFDRPVPDLSALGFGSGRASPNLSYNSFPLK